MRSQLADPRFAKVLTAEEFAIDPQGAEFRRSTGAARLLDEQVAHRAQRGRDGDVTVEDGARICGTLKEGVKGPSLDVLKRKLQQKSGLFAKGKKGG